MPNTIPASYASPLLRWALCVEDYPSATHTFDVVHGTELGIPESFGGAGEFLRCTITFGAGSGRQPAYGWKPLAGVKRNPDEFNSLSTKTLGRCLKRAGYPDDMVDLKACVLWRQRRAEIAAIQGGTPALGTGAPDTVEAALDAASVADPEALGHDDAPEVHGQAPIAATAYDGGPYGGDVEDVEDAVLVDPETGEVIDPADDLAAEHGVPAAEFEEFMDNPPSEQTREAVKAAIAESAKAGTQSALRNYAKENGWLLTDPPTERAARALVLHGIELAEAPM